MRHRLKGKKLNRNSGQRLALFRGLLRQLIIHEQIITTEAKAKAIQSEFAKLVTKAKKGDLNSRRLVLAFLRDKQAAHKLFDQIAPLFKDRAGGYLRSLRLYRRRGDAALLTQVELTVRPPAPEPKVEKKPTPKTNPPARKLTLNLKKKKAHPAPKKIK